MAMKVLLAIPCLLLALRPALADEVTAPKAPEAPAVAAPASPSTPDASPAPVSPAAEPVAPTAASPSVEAASPTAQAAVSATADADGNSEEAEEVGENGLAADPASKTALPDTAPGAWKGSVDPLYYELAKRTLKDNKDKAARQAFALALFKDADRAKAAKDQAYDDKLADTVIAQLEGGRERARMELQSLAEKGNRKARLYLGMDKPLAREDAGAESPTAQAVSGSATTEPVSSTALAPSTPRPISSAAAAPASPAATDKK